MHYLVDGHNLIPKMPGMSLQAADKEERLIELLQEFCRLARSKVEVFFDQAPPGRAGKRPAGSVTARFVQQGKLADTAILDRLEHLGKSAGQWTVVSSDHQVVNGARNRGAKAMSAEEFVRCMQAAQAKAQRAQKENPPVPAPGEVDEWLNLFKQPRK